MNSQPTGPFQDSFSGSRIGRLSDVKTETWTREMSALESFSDSYLRYLYNHQGLPGSYPWPADSLKNFTRIWEYPFASCQLKRLSPAAKGSQLLDVGPGLSFFPGYLAESGYEVTAVEIDQRSVDAFASLSRSVDAPAWTRRVSYRVGDMRDVQGIPAGLFDVVTCISVLEHIPTWEGALREISRILKPGGWLHLTFDLALQDAIPSGFDRPFTVGDFAEFRILSESLFSRMDAFQPTHPMDVLNYRNHPREIARSNVPRPRALTERIFPLSSFARRLKNKFIIQSGQFNPFCVCGISLQK